jgi:UDP-2-acetamido-2,6-beta-L-arabino-hexul-4-ose reductase
MKVLITGADGFIAKNRQLKLRERKDIKLILFTRKNKTRELAEILHEADFVFHLAGVNRPESKEEFTVGNVDLTSELYSAVVKAAHISNKKIPIVFTSSIQAELNNPYGQSKLEAENILRKKHPLVPKYIFRLPNVFGKWSRPNYNSVVATFSHNISRNLPIQINDANAPLTLVYIDDLLERFEQLLDGADGSNESSGFEVITPTYTTTIGDIAKQLESFRDSRNTLTINHVGFGLTRALYATYVSYLPIESFTYQIPRYADSRGVFVEMLKSQSCGQFSYFTALPGVTRGGHYHHSKTEKFLVIQGDAKFRFRNMLSGQTHELTTTGSLPQVIETVPGWTHDITNVGSGDLVVMLWANEIFDRNKPDTYNCPL